MLDRRLSLPTLYGAWDAFWYSEDSALNVAAARVVFAGHALWLLLSRDLAAVSELPAEFWAGVDATTRWRYLLFPGHGAMEAALQAAAVAFLLGAIVGVWPRTCCLAAGLLLYHLAPLESIFWTPSPHARGFTVSVLALLTLSFSRCGDRLVLGRPALRPPRPGDHAWALKLCQVFLAQVYFFAGYSKLFRVGWDWVSAENLRSWLLVFSQEDQVAVFRTVGPWIADRPLLCLAVAAGALLFDLAFPLALLSRRLRPWLAGLAALMHAGILVSMNIAFLNAPQLLVFLDWERMRRREARAPDP